MGKTVLPPARLVVAVVLHPDAEVRVEHEDRLAVVGVFDPAVRGQALRVLDLQEQEDEQAELADEERGRFPVEVLERDLRNPDEALLLEARAARHERPPGQLGDPRLRLRLLPLHREVTSIESGCGLDEPLQTLVLALVERCAVEAAAALRPRLLEQREQLVLLLVGEGLRGDLHDEVP
jgi:hypothetical protein